ncbi:MAG: AsmA family protein [Terriglobales bacterium]
MKSFSSKRRIAALAVILLALFTIRPGASRLKSRIIRSISAAVGRSVDIGSVHIRLLPRPGFDLENLVVYDDPAFGAEPIVRASEVTAALRLTSLLRGRMEIARLDLAEPSLNFVHGEGGHWNLEALLERSARIPLAPTGRAKSGPRPAFPYIEGTSGRINFKHGPEKKPYALTNADFSLWQESDNSWGVRLKAQPFRTDMNLNDTGLLQLTGTWQRADALRDMPLQVNLEWSRAQLGQITKLVSGNDQGWRGEILLDVALMGTPAKLHIAATSSMNDFRRYDITSGKALRMAARCDADYSTDTHDFQQLMCSAPVGDGLLTLTGDAGLPGSHEYSLAASADNIPATALVSLAQRLKKNLPEDLTAEGIVDGNLSLASDGQSPATLRGAGQIANFHLSSVSNKGEFGPETLPFAVALHAKTTRPAGTRPSNGPLLDIGPFGIGGAHPGSATIRGFLDRTGYSFSITGETEIAKALRLARMAGLPAVSSNADGSALLDLLLAGNWIVPGKGFASPQLTGTARLHNVHVLERSAGVHAEIISAEMQLMADAVHVVRLNANAAGAAWTGSLDLPRGCGTPDACPVHFALNTNQAALSNLQEWVNPKSRKRPWYRVLTRGAEAHPAWWSTLHASGRVTAGRFQIHGIEATHVSANLNVEDGKLRLAGLTADVLQGKHRGDWNVNFLKSPAVCAGAGDLADISLAAIAEVMNDGWVAGTANASYELKGPCPADFWPSTEGKLHVDVTDALFPHVMIGDGSEALQASHIKGQARLHDGQIQITDTHLISPGGTYELSGTASLKREVDLRLTRTSNGPPELGYRIGGTLEAPRVAPLSRTEQAQLKP